MTKSTHGGRRKGAGRRRGPGNRLLRIQATDAEYAHILALSTRQRTHALLDAVAMANYYGELKGEDDEGR